MNDIFAIFLNELGNLLKIELKPDEFGRALLLFNKVTPVQFEVSKISQNLLIGCELPAMSPGKYRELVLMEALKSNNSPLLPGAFGYHQKRDSLILFELFDLSTLNAKQVFEFLKPFVRRAGLWKAALVQGEVPKEINSDPEVKPKDLWTVRL